MTAAEAARLSTVKKIAIKLDPPTVFVEYAGSQQHSRLVRVVKLHKHHTADTDVDWLADKLLQNFPGSLQVHPTAAQQLRVLLQQALEHWQWHQGQHHARPDNSSSQQHTSLHGKLHCNSTVVVTGNLQPHQSQHPNYLLTAVSSPPGSIETAAAASTVSEDDLLTLEPNFLDINGMDLNKVTEYELQLAKAQMDTQFLQHLVRPGDPSYMYDKQADFAPLAARHEWDEDD